MIPWISSLQNEGVARVRGIAGMAGCRTTEDGGKVTGLGLPMTMRTRSAMEEL